MKLSRLNNLEKTQKNIKLNLVLEVEKEQKKEQIAKSLGYCNFEIFKTVNISLSITGLKSPFNRQFEPINA